MEYQGKFSHNVVRKVRWANYPFVPGIRENIKTDWSDKRLDAWVKTCTQCHSERFARAYLEFMDNGTYSGLDKYDEAHEVVHQQYKAGLLTGQKDNRPKPPAPVPPGFEQFFQIYWSKGNNPAAIELKLFEMAEDPSGAAAREPRPPTLGVHLYRRLGSVEQGLCRNHGRGHQAQGEAGVDGTGAKLEGSKTSRLFDFDSTDGKHHAR